MMMVLFRTAKRTRYHLFPDVKNSGNESYHKTCGTFFEDLATVSYSEMRPLIAVTRAGVPPNR